MSLINKIFGKSEKKLLKQYQPMVDKINALESEFEKKSDDELKEISLALKEKLCEKLSVIDKKTEEIKKQIENTIDQDNKLKLKKDLRECKKTAFDTVLPEAFALVRESSKRTIGLRPFDVQLIGGIVLHEGGIAEMKTGEGKTLAATLAIFLNALGGRGAHLITVNDYLARRDANWMAPVYHKLGLSIGCIQHDCAFIFDPQTEPDQNEVSVEMENLRQIPRKEAYACDITYGTNNEFGFDYLRDNLVLDASQMSQREHHFAVVDEVDSILIDEARTPLIISAPDTESSNKYGMAAKQILPLLQKVKFVTNTEEAEAKKFHADLGEGYDIVANEEKKSALLTQEGQNKCEKTIGIENLFEEFGSENLEWKHAIDQVIKAKIFFNIDKDYVIKNGEVIIVDSFTGRLMPGRRYSEGLHQAIEAKEGLEVRRENRTLATITFQNYFRFYEKLAGMTGTAATNAEEFIKVYGIEVVSIPTNQPIARIDRSDSIYKTEKGKFMAVARKIQECNKKNQPVLTGTISVEKSELLSDMLTQHGIKHEVLNAKNHEKEAAIIAKAGQPGAVTIATNMAGRGTDIKLNEESISAGGLFVIGTERHEARRIDNQLRGRSGRQGDHGESRFFVSLDDDLMRVFGSDRMRSIMDRFKFPEDQPIENRIISKSIESAQAKIEGYNFDTRKYVLEYDDVMNKQRDVIYKKRKQALRALDNEESQDYLTDAILEYLDNEVAGIVMQFTNQSDEQGRRRSSSYGGPKDVKVDVNSIRDEINKIVEVKKSEMPQDNLELQKNLQELIHKKYEEREKYVGSETMRRIERLVFLRIIDMLWMEHLDFMDHLRNSVTLRGFGQRDPLVEYKKEGYIAFENLLANIQTNVCQFILKANMPQVESKDEQEQKKRKNLQYSGGEESDSVSTTIRHQNKIGRNDPCPCGSGKKYKKCCYGKTD